MDRIGVCPELSKAPFSRWLRSFWSSPCGLLRCICSDMRLRASLRILTCKVIPTTMEAEWHSCLLPGEERLPLLSCSFVHTIPRRSFTCRPVRLRCRNASSSHGWYVLLHCCFASSSLPLFSWAVIQRYGHLKFYSGQSLHC